jgi:hypothetical protein
VDCHYGFELHTVKTTYNHADKEDMTVQLKLDRPYKKQSYNLIKFLLYPDHPILIKRSDLL